MKKLVQSDGKLQPLRPWSYLQSGFYGMADSLRKQLEQTLSVSSQTNGGMTPLMYVFSRDRYQFLTASAERIFTSEALEDLTEHLSGWANKMLGVCNVSTPQARVFVRGCFRAMQRDDVRAPWHFALSLSVNAGLRSAGKIKVLGQDDRKSNQGRLGIDRVISSPLEFNQLLVHATSSPYSVEAPRTSPDPIEAAIFLDGYLW